MLKYVNDIPSRRRESVDSFYLKHGKCCAGCDWWRYINSVAGTCERHAPQVEGFPITTRDQLCGDFKDEFDWDSLPLGYRLTLGLI